MNILRLCRLADVLEALPDTQKFNLNSYAGFISPDKGKHTTVRSNLTAQGLHACGTSACAVGYGALDPILHAEGLTLLALTGDYYRIDNRIIPDIDAFNACFEDETINIFDIRFEDCFGQSAIEQFFSITERQFNHLFMPSGYKHHTDHATAADVATQLRAFILNEGIPA